MFCIIIRHRNVVCIYVYICIYTYIYIYTSLKYFMMYILSQIYTTIQAPVLLSFTVAGSLSTFQSRQRGPSPSGANVSLESFLGVSFPEIDQKTYVTWQSKAESIWKYPDFRIKVPSSTLGFLTLFLNYRGNWYVKCKWKSMIALSELYKKMIYTSRNFGSLRWRQKCQLPCRKKIGRFHDSWKVRNYTLVL